MNAINTIDVKAEFNLDKDRFGNPFPAGVKFPVLNVEESTAHAIPQKELHYFEASFVSDVFTWLQEPGPFGLMITGPTGTGKSSGIAQMAARLNWPTTGITASGNFLFEDLVGSWGLVQTDPGAPPVTKFRYGPLPLAMKEGRILVINEFDYADPNELAGLNDVIRGSGLFIEATNEWIKPHPKFRVVITGNSKGYGDDTGLYRGVKTQNLAFLDRFIGVEVDYLPNDVEVKMLTDYLGLDSTHESTLSTFVTCANSVRKRFLSDSAEALSATITTPKLKLWAKESFRIQASVRKTGTSVSPPKMALEKVLTGMIPDVDAVAIHKICESHFGGLWVD
ncbi:MoxR family ATPase [uncultured Umboniibacter sp.]|uniref:AAA family ATPase n=1 Tax=uncultured Umboniibacter sp. TaxID=1798917 RepID=UPI002604FD03|nr:MoxR family ATPase [uncultured Umboniibacter sp.]